MSSLAEKEQCY